ncbi:MAG: hypothetical protein IJ184_06540 [Alphaproteobacteria bacterium]|nr:hypothetical protein [Alphaproteobacteria bacterium]
MSGIEVNWDAIVQLLANGNPFIWALLAINLFCLGVFAYIKYPEQIKSLASFILKHCSRRFRAQLDVQAERLELCKQRYEKVAEKIYGLTCRISDLRIDPDTGRNKFYQYLVKQTFEAFYKGFVTLFTDYCQGKIPEKDFISYRKTHHTITDTALKDILATISERLSSEGWPDEKIGYVNEIYKAWISAHIGLLRELLATDEMSLEVVKSWLVFFYEMFTDVEKFGLMINGRITGQSFGNLRLQGPHHE